MSPSSSTSLAAARGELRKKKQRHSAFTAMTAPRDLQSYLAHQMPTRGGHRDVRQWLDKAELLRKATFSRASQNQRRGGELTAAIDNSNRASQGAGCCQGRSQRSRKVIETTGRGKRQT